MASKTTLPDDDATRIGRALQRLRDRYDLTQPEVGDAHEKYLTRQYVSQIETGKVPGVVKPDTQRKLLAAISKAAGLQEPLGLSDLADEVAHGDTPPAPRSRVERMADALGRTGGAGRAGDRQAVFPLRDGAVTVTYPDELSPDGFAELEAYIGIWLRANRPTS